MATQFDFKNDKVTNDNIKLVGDLMEDYSPNPPVKPIEKFFLLSFSAVIVTVILKILGVL